MINYIWIGLLLIGFVVGVFTGRTKEVTDALFNYAQTAVELSIGLIGIMALWLGLLKIAEEAGLIKMLAKVLSPVMTKLFPEVPAEHPAMGAMIMNISANILGLGNAATPFGIKAMMELQTLNPLKNVATNPMVMFLAINTSSVTLIPTTIIGFRLATGSNNPTEIVGPTLVATSISTIVAIILCLLFQNTKKNSYQRYLDETQISTFENFETEVADVH